MPNNTVKHLVSEVAELKKSFNKHLEESIGIKVQLKVNTILTSVILTAIVGKFIVEIFIK